MSKPRRGCPNLLLCLSFATVIRPNPHEQDRQAPSRPGTFESLARSFTSWRTAAVTLQSFPSAIPLGLVLIAIPAWLALEGVDIKTIGFVTLAQAPWTFKFLWAPVMDRYAPPFLGRKRGWAVVAQAALLVSTIALAVVAAAPQRVWLIAAVSFFIAFASASQDIAVDAYAVEVLRPEEQGIASGSRSAMGRLAMLLSGRVTITAATWLSWPALFAIQSLIYLPATALMVFSPEPETVPTPPRTLREAVWEPFVGFLRQQRAIEIIAFLVLYKFGDNLALALISPFLLQVGFGKWDVGVAVGTLGLIATILGAILGGAITSVIGLGHALWLFGLLQAFSNIGYVLVAQIGVNRPVMYTASFVENLTIGMGTAAFSVLLLRLTQKKFSATQYALLSSIFALGRTLAGPVAGVLVDAMGWRNFFVLTIFSAIPGLAMLQRFVPLGCREPLLALSGGREGPPLRRGGLIIRALGGCAAGLFLGALCSGTLEAFRAMRATPGSGFALAPAMMRLIGPTSVGDWFSLVAVALFGASCGLAWAALAAARRGAGFAPSQGPSERS